VALNQSTGATSLTNSWSWGDASANDTGAAPSHIYAIAGGYNVCVSVIDANNCTATFCDSSYLSRMNSANSVVTINVVSSLPSGILTINENALQIYPNPTNHATVVSLQTAATNATIKLTNSIGQTIIEKTNQSGNQFTVDLSNQLQGIYFIEIKEQGNVWRSKIIKQTN
jgi:PKD repeat protein